MNTVADFLAPAQSSIASFDQWVNASVDRVRVDHIGYKCGSTEEFERLRALLEPHATFLYQSFISGRRIALIKFTSFLETSVGPIHFLELSDQKPDGSQKSGFDHLELYPLTGDVEALAAFYTQQGSHFDKSVRPHHTTYDCKITPTFQVRLEPESLIQKIIREELR